MKRKTLRNTLIIAVCFLAGAIISYVLVDQSKNREEQAAQEELAALQLFSFDENAVDSVTIDNADGHFEFGLTSGVWQITETTYEHPFTLNTYYLNSVCSYMSDLTAEQKIDADTAQLAAYGLAEPVTVTCHIGSSAYTLYVGTASATEEYWYAMMPDSTAVYSIPYNEGEVLHGGMTYLRNPYIVDAYDVDITAVALTHDGETVFDVEEIGGKWKMHEPLPNATINAAQISDLLTDITRTQSKEFLEVLGDGTDLVSYGLHQPSYILSIKAYGQTTTLEFSDFSTENDTVYMLDRATGQISSLPVSSVSFLGVGAEGLLSDKLLTITLYETTGLEVTVDDLHFTMEHGDGIYRINGEEIGTSADDTLVSLYHQLFGTVANLSTEAIDLDSALPEEPEPTCEFIFTLADGTQRTVTLVPQEEDSTLYWAYIDGAYSGFTVRRRALSGTNGVLNFYEKMTDALEENA